MARHIMAVCVVCLLCADHLPCLQHVETLLPAPANIGSTHLNAVVYNTNDFSYSASSKAQSKKTTEAYATTNSDNRRRRRIKRHADHSHEDNTQAKPEITEAFLKRIFNEFGSGNETIHIHDFQRMLEKLGLHQLLSQQFQKHDKNNNENCIDDSKLVHYVKPHNPPSHDRHDQDHKHHHHHRNQNSEEKLRNCTNSTEGCVHAHTSSSNGESIYLNYTLNQEDILNVCPVLLYQLSSAKNPLNAGCISGDILLEIDEHESKHYQHHQEDIVWVWIYAFCSVFACSMLGLVGVAIIPFMNSRFYKHIIQVLVSLAVGTMTGDALLHLLPHSLAGQNERNMIFKGLTCMGGIILFYITEHGLTMISEWRKNVEKKNVNQPSRAKVMRDPDSSLNNSVAGDKVCKSKYSSYPYCYDEIAMNTKNDVWLHLPNKTMMESSGSNLHNGKLESDENTTQSLLSTSQNNYAPIAETNHCHNHHQNDLHQQQHNQNQQQHGHCQAMSDNNAVATALDGNISGDGAINTVTAAATNGKDLMNDNTVTVILREHESSHHGHSHKHGHVHSPPETLSAVVWMIIMGDGLHNFTDGMAIGAAFAENMAGGFSTALAVFCHELPHELGDFAILMKAGMSVKSAVFYNLLTGVLSFIGMIFGIVFGQSHDTAQWMFAAAAGLFIYIAMVDMMPEISAAHKSIQQFALQIVGMGSGVLLMLLIAIYEDDLRNVFSNT